MLRKCLYERLEGGACLELSTNNIFKEINIKSYLSSK